MHIPSPESLIKLKKIELVGKLHTSLKTIEQLQQEITELKDKAAKNSSNSHKPPSSDGYEKPDPKSSREKSDKKVGGQKGHKGETLNQVDNPDVVKTHTIDECSKCGAPLGVEVLTHECRQEFDLAPSKVIVTEHQGEQKLCSNCGYLNKASFPENINHPVQYGSRVKSYAVYLSQQQFVPYKRLKELFADCFSMNISQGSFVNFNKYCAKKIAPSVELIRQNVMNSKVVNFDESGMRVCSKLGWLHVSSTTTNTYYEIHNKRGEEAMDAINILPLYKGIAVHDHWKSYFKYTECQHSLCNAHHIRELKFSSEKHAQQWASKLITLLSDISKKVKEYKKDKTSQFEKYLAEEYEQKYDQILQLGLAEIPILPEPETKKRGKKKQHKAKNLLDRLKNYKKETLLFMCNFDVPFTNNLGENDIRMCKVKSKISGTFRSNKGSKVFTGIRSYISTARKQEVNIMDALADAFNGNPFMPAK